MVESLHAGRYQLVSKLRKLLLISIVLALTFSVASAAFLTFKNAPLSQDNYAEAIVQARTEIWQDINSGKASSATIAILDNGQIVYSEGFGMADRAESIPVDTKTMFNIGSVSKTFCTAAVMLLVDDGKVNLDDPVIKYLPEFTMADARYKDITVRMLLNHVSGLPGTKAANDVGYDYNPAFYKDVFTSLSQSHLKAAPGEMAPYTNDGFSLAEMLVVRVSGESYADFLSQKIFNPLSLDHTGVSVGEQSGKTIAAFYQPESGKKVPAEVLSVLGAGGLASTAEDLVRFADSFAQNGKHILSSSSIAEMTKAQPSAFALQAEKQIGINPELAYGLGLDMVGIPYYQEKGIYVIEKGGDTDDYHSMLVSAPQQRLSVAIIEAGHGSSVSTIIFDIFNTALQEKGLMQKEDAPVSMPPTTENIPAKYASFAGYYAPNYKVSFDFEANNCVLGVLASGTVARTVSLSYYDNCFHTPDGGKYYFVSVGGQDYFVTSAYNNMAYDVMGQKLPALSNPLSLRIDINGTQWLRRNVQPFEALSYAVSHIAVSGTIDGLPGYMDFGGFKEVKSPDYAGMPSGAIRDETELNLFDKEGQVWAQVYDCLYSPASVATTLKNGTNTALISSSGYNEWFKVTEDTILSFQKQVQDRVIVFSQTGAPVYDSIMDNGAVFVAQGSFVELAGASGDVFTVTTK
jgi:CubicO group peptidase (beta-lactamase class C family)